MACKYCDSVEYQRGMCVKCLVVHLKAEIFQLRQALRPFAHPDLSMVTSGNVQGGSSPVFQRNRAVLRIGDFKKAASLDLSPICICPDDATDEACGVCIAGDEGNGVNPHEIKCECGHSRAAHSASGDCCYAATYGNPKDHTCHCGKFVEVVAQYIK